jgi:hypothetical protein
MSTTSNATRFVPVAAAAAAVVASIAVGGVALSARHHDHTVSPAAPHHAMHVGIRDFTPLHGGRVMIGQ